MAFYQYLARTIAGKMTRGKIEARDEADEAPGSVSLAQLRQRR